MYGRGPPSFAPSSGGYGGGRSGGPPPGYGAPVHDRGYSSPQPRGHHHHAGLGSHGAAPNLPRPANLPPTPQTSMSPGAPMGGSAGGGGAERYSLFVGSIVDGLETGWLEKILAVAGPVTSFRRPSPPFAFVEYGEPESVLRCLEVVNAAKIKMPSGAEKELLVKADEKTRGRLDEYEKERVQNQDFADMTQQAKDDLATILSRIASGDPISGTAPPGGKGSDDDDDGPKIPQHLKDLAPEDLPENHRETTLSSIAQFRQAAVKKAQQKFDIDRQLDERRQAQMHQRPPPQSSQHRSSYSSSQGPAGSPPIGAGSAAAAADPQSFNRPVAFVAGGGGGGASSSANGTTDAQPEAEPVLDDAERERERAEREHRRLEGIFLQRERQFEHRERSRIAAWEREQARERGLAEQEERESAYMAERLAMWDDDREAERGRELFYIDRVRWRSQRKALRTREAEADARDREHEARQLAALSDRSDSFLAQHADLLASSLPPNASQTGSPRGGGTNGTGGSTPGAPAAAAAGGVKLSFNAAAAKPAAQEAPKARPTALALEDEEETTTKKRELIPLEYSDDDEGAPPKPRMTRTEMERKAREIEEKVPTSKEGLWAFRIRWKRLSDDIIKRRIEPYANRAIVGYLGAEEPELVNAITEYLRAHKTPQELLEELEPVLDEDAQDLVVKVWRVLAIETEYAAAGVDI
ncbi:hypothetical protein RHOSPDRAFT_34264 [Rhodotorula sp. JG-1b]|nr:hypothetical protein RHOSPDRAFT_34264 [Rhodotorula sp. JG-1b]